MELRVQDEQAELYYWRGLILADLGDFPLALVDFAYALDLVPQDKKYSAVQDRALQAGL